MQAGDCGGDVGGLGPALGEAEPAIIWVQAVSSQARLDVDGFFLEYDDERSRGFEPLRFVPQGKMVVLGLVTTKRPELESKHDLKRRVDEASKYVPLDQICLSGQCGFSPTFEDNALTYDDQVAKLRLIVETARDIWGDWPPGRPGP